jgi:hypothetical protein
MELLNSEPQPLVRFAWTVRDNEYVYMDTWEMTQEEWDALTPEEIERRQKEQYAKWREYMANPVT